VGFPHPSEASTAASGSTSVSPLTYRLLVMGSTVPLNASPPQQLFTGPQHPPASAVGAASATASTRRAAAPYFSRTTVVTSADSVDMRAPG
jgi:hypothetical protein